MHARGPSPDPFGADVIPGRSALQTPMARRRLACALLLGSLGCSSPSDGGDTVVGRVPCVTGSAACAQRVTIAPGLFIPVHTTHDLLEADASLSRAVIVVHGTDRNGDDYFERMVAAADEAGVLDSTLIVAPTFKTVDDGPAADEPYWTSGGWKRGHLSSSSGPSPRVSSYATIDRIIEQIVGFGRFPALHEIVVTGHSAGGQVAHRFAATSGVEDSWPGLSVRYVVANPSTYLYLGPERDGPAGFVVPDAGSCPDYDEWHYGLEDLNSYAATATVDSVRARLVRRDVRILLGDADSLAANLDASCGANLQGRHRLERGRTLIRAMDALHPGHAHKEMLVPGVGHSSSRMYRSSVGRTALFGK